MAKKEERPVEAPTDGSWEYYHSIQLTPEQKAELRARVEAQAEKAAESGVYEKLLALRGKVHLDLDIDELREDRD
ncbi:MAG TPA: hypothetical protein VGF69_14580 [Thermoanaerobaculia bacterium]